MATFKDLEDNLKTFIIQEQSDAHSKATLNTAKYNNIKITMNPSQNNSPHVKIRISISEASYKINDFSKINGGLGYEERLVIKWFGRYGIKEKLLEMWNTVNINKEDN